MAATKRKVVADMEQGMPGVRAMGDGSGGPTDRVATLCAALAAARGDRAANGGSKTRPVVRNRDSGSDRTPCEIASLELARPLQFPFVKAEINRPPERRRRQMRVPNAKPMPITLRERVLREVVTLEGMASGPAGRL